MPPNLLAQSGDFGSKSKFASYHYLVKYGCWILQLEVAIHRITILFVFFNAICVL